MKTLSKIILLVALSFANFSFCQEAMMRTLSDAKKLETNKHQFIGKPLKYLLDNISPEIKGVIPIPNKKPDKINKISFVFVPLSVYFKDIDKRIDGKRTRVSVEFGQNKNWLEETNKSEFCNSDIPECIIWTKTDEQNLGNLIVRDIRVYGKEPNSPSNSDDIGISTDLN